MQKVSVNLQSRVRTIAENFLSNYLVELTRVAGKDVVAGRLVPLSVLNIFIACAYF